MTLDGFGNGNKVDRNAFKEVAEKHEELGKMEVFSAEQYNEKSHEIIDQIDNTIDTIRDQYLQAENPDIAKQLGVAMARAFKKLSPENQAKYVGMLTEDMTNATNLQAFYAGYNEKSGLDVSGVYTVDALNKKNEEQSGLIDQLGADLMDTPDATIPETNETQDDWQTKLNQASDSLTTALNTNNTDAIKKALKDYKQAIVQARITISQKNIVNGAQILKVHEGNIANAEQALPPQPTPEQQELGQKVLDGLTGRLVAPLAQPKNSEDIDTPAEALTKKQHKAIAELNNAMQILQSGLSYMHKSAVQTTGPDTPTADTPEEPQTPTDPTKQEQRQDAKRNRKAERFGKKLEKGDLDKANTMVDRFERQFERKKDRLPQNIQEQYTQWIADLRMQLLPDSVPGSTLDTQQRDFNAFQRQALGQIETLMKQISQGTINSTDARSAYAQIWNTNYDFKADLPMAEFASVDNALLAADQLITAQEDALKSPETTPETETEPETETITTDDLTEQLADDLAIDPAPAETQTPAEPADNTPKSTFDFTGITPLDNDALQNKIRDNINAKNMQSTAEIEQSEADRAQRLEQQAKDAQEAKEKAKEALDPALVSQLMTDIAALNIQHKGPELVKNTITVAKKLTSEQYKPIADALGMTATLDADNSYESAKAVIQDLQEQLGFTDAVDLDGLFGRNTTAKLQAKLKELAPEAKSTVTEVKESILTEPNVPTTGTVGVQYTAKAPAGATHVQWTLSDPEQDKQFDMGQTETMTTMPERAGQFVLVLEYMIDGKEPVMTKRTEVNIAPAVATETAPDKEKKTSNIENNEGAPEEEPESPLDPAIESFLVERLQEFIDSGKISAADFDAFDIGSSTSEIRIKGTNRWFGGTRYRSLITSSDIYKIKKDAGRDMNSDTYVIAEAIKSRLPQIKAQVNQRFADREAAKNAQQERETADLEKQFGPFAKQFQEKIEFAIDKYGEYQDADFSQENLFHVTSYMKFGKSLGYSVSVKGFPKAITVTSLGYNKDLSNTKILDQYLNSTAFREKMAKLYN